MPTQSSQSSFAGNEIISLGRYKGSRYQAFLQLAPPDYIRWLRQTANSRNCSEGILNLCKFVDANVPSSGWGGGDAPIIPKGSSTAQRRIDAKNLYLGVYARGFKQLGKPRGC